MITLRFQENDFACFGYFFFSSRRRHTRYWRDWSSDVCSSDLKTLTKYRPQDWNEIVIVVKDGVAHCTCNGEVLEAALKVRSEERRVGKECRSRWSPYH